MDPSTIFSLTDSAVDAVLDSELRALLSASFTGPDDHVFRERRYFRTPPLHRWLLRDAQGVRAHVAAHDLVAGHAGGTIRFAGIAEVCVRLDERGRGHVRRLLEQAHRDLASQGFAWAALLGKPEVYASSGYRPTGQPLRYHDARTGEVRVQVHGSFQTAQLRPDAQPWPGGELDLNAPLF